MVKTVCLASKEPNKSLILKIIDLKRKDEIILKVKDIFKIIAGNQKVRIVNKRDKDVMDNEFAKAEMFMYSVYPDWLDYKVTKISTEITKNAKDILVIDIE